MFHNSFEESETGSWQAKRASPPLHCRRCGSFIFSLEILIFGKVPFWQHCTRSFVAVPFAFACTCWPAKTLPLHQLWGNADKVEFAWRICCISVDVNRALVSVVKDFTFLRSLVHEEQRTTHWNHHRLEFFPIPSLCGLWVRFVASRIQILNAAFSTYQDVSANGGIFVISGEVNWPVCTKTDNRIGSSGVVSKWPPVFCQVDSERVQFHQ